MWYSIKQIRKLFTDPSPHNHPVNFRELNDPTYEDGNCSFADKGLPDLTKYNDETARPITRRATLSFIELMILTEIQNIETAKQQTLNSQQQMEHSSLDPKTSMAT